MKFGSRKSAFTLIELLVVVAIIALLLSILLPSLSGAREQGKRAKCLANLSSLNKAVAQYASEDSKEQLVPIQMNMMRTVNTWEWKTICWYTWGGQNAKQAFRVGPSIGYWLSDDPNPPGDGQYSPEAGISYAANRRPLNLTMISDVGQNDSSKMNWFECPSDKGFPAVPDPLLVPGSPMENAERSCYQTMGNSYSALLTGWIGVGGPHAPNDRGNFAVGPWGHRASTLTDTGRQVAYFDGTWYAMVGAANNEGGGEFQGALVELNGWHRKKLADNVAYADGSVRLTQAELRFPVEEEGMQIDPEAVEMIRRTSTYRLDVYPVGGAIIFGEGWTDNKPDAWPWRNFQDNLRSGIVFTPQ